MNPVDFKDEIKRSVIFKEQWVSGEAVLTKGKEAVLRWDNEWFCG